MHDLHHKIQAQWSVSVSASAMKWIIYNFHFLNNAEIIQPCWRAEFLDRPFFKKILYFFAEFLDFFASLFFLL